MTIREKAIVAVSLLVILGASASTSAEQLTLGYETTASGTVITSLTPQMPNAANFYGNSFSAPTTTVPGSGTPGDGFYDAFLFVVPDASIDSITTSIDLTDISSISNLQVRLFDFSLNPTPNEPNPPNGPVINASWNQVPLSGGETEMIDTIPTTTLTAGTYVLEVRGNVIGANGGSYSGTLNVSPVPVPGALPLLLSGLGLLGGAASRRRA